MLEPVSLSNSGYPSRGAVRPAAYPGARTGSGGHQHEPAGWYRTLLEQIPAVTYIRALGTGELLYLSPQVERMLGFPPEELACSLSAWLDRIHHDDRPRVLAETARTQGEIEPYQV